MTTFTVMRSALPHPQRSLWLEPLVVRISLHGLTTLTLARSFPMPTRRTWRLTEKRATTLGRLVRTTLTGCRLTAHLQFDGSDQLGVNISDVVEHLQQRIRYYTSDTLDHDTEGSAAGQVYTTSRYPKNISTIKAEVRPDTPSIYKAGIYTVDDNNQILASLGQSADTDEIPSGASQILTFSMLDDADDSLGVPLSGNERIAVLIRRAGAGNSAHTRLRRGGEAANSPNESYPDAELDFVLENHVVYQHEDPANGNNTESHGTSIRGNIRIFYTVTIDHGSLIGDGNVNAAHIDSESATDDQFLGNDGAGTAVWKVPPGGVGGGASLSDDDPEDVGTTAPGTDTEASRSDHVHAGDIDLADAAPEDVGTAAAGTSADASRADHIHGGGGAGSLSSADPEDVGEAADDGTGTNASKSDHVHRLPVQNTLQFNAAGAVGVSIADVVEHLQQNIRYYTSNDDYSTDGSAAGHVYTTSRFPKNISRVTAHLTPPSGISDAIYKVGVYTVTSGNQIIAVLGQSADSAEISAEGTYSFDLTAEGSDAELGISLAGDERIAILVRRIGAGNEADTGLRHGSAAANSPNVSYPDAEIDFDDVNHVIYRHENPEAGDDTHSHGNDIRGNLRIFYTVTIDHGSLVGDGNVNAGHIDSESATDDQFLGNDGAGAAVWKVPGGGTGLTETQATDDTDTTLGLVSGELLSAAVAEFESDSSGGGGGGSRGKGYSDWADIGSVTGAITSGPVTLALDTGRSIDDYEEMFIHIEANDANDQRSVSPRFRTTDVPETTLVLGGLMVGFPGFNTDEGAIFVRRNADGDSLVLDPHGSNINFPATSVTTIYARGLTVGGASGREDLVDEIVLDTPNVLIGTLNAGIFATTQTLSLVADSTETIAGRGFHPDRRRNNPRNQCR